VACGAILLHNLRSSLLLISGSKVRVLVRPPAKSSTPDAKDLVLQGNQWGNSSLGRQTHAVGWLRPAVAHDDRTWLPGLPARPCVQQLTACGLGRAVAWHRHASSQPTRRRHHGFKIAALQLDPWPRFARANPCCNCVIISHSRCRLEPWGRRGKRCVFLRLLVRTHRSEIMLGVLVIILCPNRVADLGFGTSER
jgi:hypothetical protein